ncbi:MAG: hypothetical protein U1E14_14925 [Geminicoccaceae bacterium]
MYRPVERFAVNVRQVQSPLPEPPRDGATGLWLLQVLVWLCAAALLAYAGWLFVLVGGP